jgi:hypothetical protein
VSVSPRRPRIKPSSSSPNRGLADSRGVAEKEPFTARYPSLQTVRSQAALFAVALTATSLAARDVPAETPSCAVMVKVVGHGTIRLVIADGASRPCDGSGNKVLFSGHAKADDVIKLVSSTGSVCVDHTYGSMRESQWAGASIWSGARGLGPRPEVTVLSGSLSTDEP